MNTAAPSIRAASWLTRRRFAHVGYFPRLGLFRSAAERRRFGRLIVYGLLWAVVLTAIEVPNLPGDAANLERVIPVTLQFLSNFVILGVGLAIALYWATTGLLDWRRIGMAVVASSLTASVVLSLGVSSFWVGWATTGPGASIVRADMPSGALIAYHAWLSIVYGGAAAVLYGLRLRVEQTTHALHSATLARERSEAAIAEARISALVERIEPGFLLDVMQAARLQYRSDHAHAEAILDHCVVFLRAAMPQIRSGRSDIAAEFALADAYLALRASLAGSGPAWRIERDTVESLAMSADAIGLPPMVLLPILEQLLAAIAAGTLTGPLVIRERRADGSTPIVIEIVALAAPSADANTVDEPVENVRLDAIALRLRLACGADASIVADRTEPRVVVYRFRLPRSSRERLATAAAGTPATFPSSQQEYFP